MATFTWLDGRPRVSLPVDAYLDEVLRLLRSNRVVIVQAETGAGKTIRIGQAATLFDPSLMVHLTQLTRTSVRSNGARIADELGCRPGQLVGWWLRREESRVSEATRLQLMIDQSLSNMIRRSGGRLPEGLIIVDEAHVQSIPTALLLGMIKEALAASPRTRVLVTSATIDTDKFSAFFGDAPVVKIPGRMFRVTTEPMVLLEDEFHADAVTRVAIEDIDRFLAGKLFIPVEESDEMIPVSSGKILAIQPGVQEIRESLQEIAAHVKKIGATDRIEFLPGNADITPEEEAEIYRPVRDGVLQLIVGTDRLRMSVTVPGTVGVIDSLRKRRPIVDDRGVAHMATIAISLAEVEQAKGRAGRLQPGFYQPCTDGSEYLCLDPYPIPPIQQASVTSVALNVAMLGRNIRTFPFVDPPSADRIDNALLRLTRLRALNDDETITPRGETFLEFNRDPERAAMLIEAARLQVLPEAAIVCGFMDTEGIFVRPKDRFGKVIIGEELLREILIRVVKTEVDGVAKWSESATRRELQPSDLDDLPPWIRRCTSGDRPWSKHLSPMWEVTCIPAQGFPWIHGAHMLYQFMRERLAGDTESDFTAVINAYRWFKQAEQQMRIHARWLAQEYGKNGSRNDKLFPTMSRLMRRWCDERFLHHKGMRKLSDSVAELVEDIDASSLILDTAPERERPYDVRALTMAIAAGHVDNIASCYGRQAEGPIGEFQLAYASVAGKRNGLIVVARVNKWKDPGEGGRIQAFADVAAPVEPTWLLMLLPHLCEQKPTGDYRYDPESDTTLERVQIDFIGRSVGTVEIARDNDEEASCTFSLWLYESAAEMPGSVGEILRENARLLLTAEQISRQTGSVVNLVPGGLRYTDWLLAQCGSACRLRDIDADSLRLPEISAELVEKAIRDFPPHVTILDRDWRVLYQAGRAIVDLDAETLRGRWPELPDSPVTLPSGKQIVLRLRVDWTHTFEETQPRELEQKVREILVGLAWGRWYGPYAACPRLEDLDVTIPEPRTIEAFKDPLGASELFMAYGAVSESGRPWPDSEAFVYRWYRSREEASQARDGAIVYYRKAHAEIPDKLRFARELRAGLAIRNFKAWHRRGGKSKNGDGWVIRSDGKLRERDETSAPGKSDGNFTWCYVGSDELALRWTCENTDGVDSTSTFEVVKLPRGGVTTEQLAKVQQIEKELKVRSGSFGITTVIDRAIPTLRVEFYSAVAKCPCCSKALEWDDEMITAVCSSEGRPLSCCDGDETLAAVFDAEQPCEWRCSGVGAQAMERKPVGDHGEVLTLVFQKGGSWRAALRYRAKDSKRA